MGLVCFHRGMYVYIVSCNIFLQFTYILARQSDHTMIFDGQLATKSWFDYGTRQESILRPCRQRYCNHPVTASRHHLTTRLISMQRLSCGLVKTKTMLTSC